MASNSFWQFLRRIKKEFSGVTYFPFKCPPQLPSCAWLSLWKFVHDPDSRVLMATELCLLPALIWPFSYWPGASWLIHHVWSFMSSGFLPKALAADSIQLRKSYPSSTSMMQESPFNTRVNWNLRWMQHFSSSVCRLVPVLLKYYKWKSRDYFRDDLEQFSV